MIYKYLDASRYQGKIDWDAVKRSGKIDGAILKTVSTNKSFGGVYIDPQFERNYSECTRLGIPVGAYYYTYAQNEAARAVELVKVRQALTGKTFQLPVAVDVEESFVMNRPFGFDVSGSKGEIAQQVGETADNPAVVEADGQVTAQKNVALGMFAADCLPVLMADAEAGVIGAAHCGRRGLQNGVIGATVEKMVAKGAKPERIVATLGPCICGDCYEVGGDVADEFDAQFPGTFTLSRFGQPGIDIAAAALQELAKAGVPADNVVSSRARVNAATQYLSEDEELAEICQSDGEGEPQLAERFKKIRRSLCTLENPLWFSHRRATIAGKAHEGRMLALIVRE